MKVIPKFNGFCAGVQFVQGQEIELSKEILKAIGKDSYTVVAEEAPVKEPKKEEKKIDTAEDKQITSAQNK